MRSVVKWRRHVVRLLGQIPTGSWDLLTTPDWPVEVALVVTSRPSWNALGRFLERGDRQPCLRLPNHPTNHLARTAFPRVKKRQSLPNLRPLA
jgi:hypothetical protein